MIKDKISSQEIIDQVASKASVSKRAAEEFVKMMISTIEEALMDGEVVKIKNFGTFKMQWNEPRKSVNIQTGEDILLSGYHKVTFTPDIILRDLVNEPFAHLEPVLLDPVDESPSIELKDNVPLNPLRIFTEQASEIKNLLSEIQSLSPAANIEEEEIEEEEIIEEEPAVEEIKPAVKIEIPDYVFPDTDISENTTKTVQKEAEPETNTSFTQEAKVNAEINTYAAKSTEENKEIVVTPDVPDTASNTTTTEYIPNPFVKDVKPLKKKRIGLWILVAFIILIGAGVGSYFIFSPVRNIAGNIYTNTASGIQSAKENLSLSEMVNTVSKWFVSTPKQQVIEKPAVLPVILPDSAAIDSTQIKAEKIDSLQLLFDNPRVYDGYLATERISKGSRLALMALKYYGSSDFWVYIYEANKDHIPNPDNIASGTLIHIPRLDARLIDYKNPRCIKKARELHDLYVK